MTCKIARRKDFVRYDGIWEIDQIQEILANSSATKRVRYERIIIYSNRINFNKKIWPNFSLLSNGNYSRIEFPALIACITTIRCLTRIIVDSYIYRMIIRNLITVKKSMCNRFKHRIRYVCISRYFDFTKKKKIHFISNRSFLKTHTNITYVHSTITLQSKLMSNAVFFFFQTI